MPQRCHHEECVNRVTKMCCGELYCDKHIRSHICQNKLPIIEKLESVQTDVIEKKVKTSRKHDSYVSNNLMNRIDYGGMLQVMMNMLQYKLHMKVISGVFLTWIYLYLNSYLPTISIVLYCILKGLFDMKREMNNRYLEYFLDNSNIKITLMIVSVPTWIYICRCNFETYVIFMGQWYLLKVYDRWLMNLNSVYKASELKANTQLLLTMINVKIKKKQSYFHIGMDIINCLILPFVIGYLINSECRVPINISGIFCTIILLTKVNL